MILTIELYQTDALASTYMTITDLYSYFSSDKSGICDVIEFEILDKKDLPYSG